MAKKTHSRAKMFPKHVSTDNGSNHGSEKAIGGQQSQCLVLRHRPSSNYAGMASASHRLHSCMMCTIPHLAHMSTSIGHASVEHEIDVCILAVDGMAPVNWARSLPETKGRS